MSDDRKAATTAPAHRKLSPALKLGLELGPLVIFFLANSYAGIYMATGIFMVATLVALFIMWVLARRVAIMPLVSAVLVFVFGGLTLWLQDDHFIKLKPTLIYLALGVVLLGGLAFRKPLMPYVFDGMMKLTDEGWHKLTLRWGIFFLVMAVLNEVVARSVSTDTWVAFKTFGFLPLTVIFAMLQAPLMARSELKGEAGE
ncbi:septation protein A [Xanthobacter sp. TB0136]|uniref:septation protein A n=1 Tax=Xanthobacter sp. TB0136 TaxID=3459177 RepID=UPI004039D4FB